MFKQLFIGAITLFSASLFAKPAYISDDVFIFMHSGPSKQYRIIGTIEAGMKVNLTGNTQGDFVELNDPKGKLGWVESSSVMQSASFRAQHEAMVKSSNKLKADNARLSKATEEQTKELREMVEQLEQENLSSSSEIAQLKKRLADAEKSRDEAQADLDFLENNQKFQLWREGGFIALLGAILGVILVFMPRPRSRKQSGNWIN